MSTRVFSLLCAAALGAAGCRPTCEAGGTPCEPPSACNAATGACELARAVVPADELFAMYTSAVLETPGVAEVTAGDFDGDGVRDVLAGDTIYSLSGGTPQELPFAAFPGTVLHATLANVLGSADLDFVALFDDGDNGTRLVIADGTNPTGNKLEKPLAVDATARLATGAIEIGEGEGEVDHDDVAVMTSTGLSVFVGAEQGTAVELAENLLVGAEVFDVATGLDAAGKVNKVVLAIRPGTVDVIDQSIRGGNLQTKDIDGLRRVFAIPVAVGDADISVLALADGQVSRVDARSSGAAVKELVPDLDPVSATFGDFNGDGRLDYAIADGNRACILDDGAAPCHFIPLDAPVSLAAGDFNADGLDDLVSLSAGGELTILLAVDFR